MSNDKTDHFRWTPLQTDFAQNLLREYGMPTDISTAVLIDEKGAHKESSSILRLMPYMGVPFNIIGRVGLGVPAVIRDAAYRAFAANRGAIWKRVQKITGYGDTRLEEDRERILGLVEPLDPSWGFAND
jgi:predicted DCC family thiol-disulfide oxidoreductase YuxK